MATRIYAVTNTKDNAVSLVDAGTPSQAIRHVAREQYTAAVATQAELVQLVQKGIKVEKAAAE